MSSFDGPDVNILHEADVRDVIQDEIEDTVGRNRANISDAETAHALSEVYDDAEVEGALDALGSKINAILDILLANGIMDEEEGQ